MGWWDGQTPDRFYPLPPESPRCGFFLAVTRQSVIQRLLDQIAMPPCVSATQFASGVKGSPSARGLSPRGVNPDRPAARCRGQHNVVIGSQHFQHRIGHGFPASA